MVPGDPRFEPFTQPANGRSRVKPSFGPDRGVHGCRLQGELEKALQPTEDAGTDTDGVTITFESFAGLGLALESLDPQVRGERPELLCVSDQQTDQGTVQLASVHIPAGQRDYFLNRLEKYVETAGETRARHAELVERIASIRKATIRELWTDPEGEFPTDGAPRWWEVWLRSAGGGERARFEASARQRGLRTGENYLGFSDRTVVLLRATVDELAVAFGSLDDLAELRRPHDVASLLTALSAREQSEWVDDLRGRLRPAGPDAPAVAVLDTGVQHGHPLLQDSLGSGDVHVVDPGWSIRPTDGHGTEMAGLALYGDMHAATVGNHVIDLRHGLESVKILSGAVGNDPELYGAITGRAVDRLEIAAAERSRALLLAVTAPRPETPPADKTPRDDRDAGRPTSWSASIDALSYGRAVDSTDLKVIRFDRDEPRRPRLFVISAGNIPDLDARDDHLERSDREPVEDPAQAWNALTVGAHSARDDMSGAPVGFSGYSAIAPRGELSPVSRTSVVFDRKWPFKPDVVADGGNAAASPDRTSVDHPENLSVLTTRLQGPGQGFYTTTRDTSAAAAQVAAIAADVWAAYPHLHPETVRALVVHSARWTDTMRGHLPPGSTKTQHVALLRRYGMGVPDSGRALRSATDALTLVAEARIHPYERGKGGPRTREMTLHELPWPTDELERLGEASVELRVTLSYFVDPNPSSRGWNGRYVYPSHGLRFAMRRPDESGESFRKRINKQARDGDEKAPSLRTEQGWFFGSDHQQAAGSLHADVWRGTAADLASKDAVAVYPVAGWWKSRPAYDQSDAGVDYSLVVSIESPEVEVDLWTPVSQQVAGVVEVAG